MQRSVIVVAAAILCALSASTALAQCCGAAQVAYAPAVDYSAYYAPAVSYYTPAVSYASYYTPAVSYYAPCSSCGSACSSCSSCAAPACTSWRCALHVMSLRQPRPAQSSCCARGELLRPGGVLRVVLRAGRKLLHSGGVLRVVLHAGGVLRVVLHAGRKLLYAVHLVLWGVLRAYSTYYASAYAPYGVVGSSIYGTAKVYVPGEPVRNALRAVTP